MCAEQGLGYGRQLMEFMQQMSWNALYKVEYISLSSLAHTINFYQKARLLAFEPSKGMEQEDAKTITPIAQQVSSYFFANTRQALENPEMAHFIELLLQEKLTLNKETHELSELNRRWISDGIQVTSRFRWLD